MSNRFPMSDSRQPIPSNQTSALTQLVRTLRLVWRLLNDSRVSTLPKLIIPAALVYLLSPIDVLPDFILGLGQLDDLGVILLSIGLFIEFCPDPVVAEHRRAIARGARAGQPPTEDAIDGTYRVVSDDEK